MEDKIPNMSIEDKAKVLDILSESCFEFIANMNDTFAYACGDAERFTDYDLDRLAPLISKYGHNALVAFAAVKRNAEPIDCKCNHKNPEYYAAKEEIEKLKVIDEYFMDAI